MTKSLKAGLILLIMPCYAPLLAVAQQKNLSPKEQASFLSGRTSGSLSGTFDSYCSLLYAIKDVAIDTANSQVNQTRLVSVWPSFYQPTWRELFDAIARQTRSSWKYDSERGYWVFGGPRLALPYRLQVAPGWQSDDRGVEVDYRPKIAPGAMDVYWMGAYSSDVEKNTPALLDRVREGIALKFARNFKKDVTVREMSKVRVGKMDALYLQVAGPRAGVIWREWVFSDKGQTFAIVSAIKPQQEKVILSDVLAMVNSFEVVN